MKLAADDVQSVVIPGCGHYCQLSSGLDAQVRVPDRPETRGRACCDRSP